MYIALTLLVMLFLAIVLGPRVKVDTSFTLPTLPDNLDKFLQDSEAQFTDITSGAEKSIHWHTPNQTEKVQTELAFTYFHGFSATRQESMPVPKRIAEHFKSNIYYTRLAGNGRSDEAMAEGSVNSWIADAVESLSICKRLGKRTVIIGTSTGASLAWWVANQPEFKEQIAALVFFSPNFGLADAKGPLLAAPWGKQIAEMVIGPYRRGTVESEQHGKYWATSYPTRALLPMMGLVKLAKKISRRKNKIPVFIIYSPHDTTVNASKIESFYDAIRSTKDRLIIDNPTATSQHVIVGDILAPENNDAATESTIAFLEKVLNASH